MPVRIGDKDLKELTDRELDDELRRRRQSRGQSPRNDEPRRSTRRSGRNSRGSRRGRGAPGWKVRQFYRNLELEPGASRDEVELAYVRLSEKYHPDRQTDPDRKRVATQLLAGLREAYRGILESLGEDDEED